VPEALEIPRVEVAHLALEVAGPLYPESQEMALVALRRLRKEISVGIFSGFQSVGRPRPEVVQGRGVGLPPQMQRRGVMIYLAAVATATFIVAIHLTFRCRHAWAVVSDKDFPPMMDDLTKNGHRTSFYHSDELARFTKRTYIAIVKCDKCGALKTFREESD
jgi:hypothetical protein